MNKRGRRLSRPLGVLMSVSLLALAVSAIAYQRRHAWEPLGDYPVQTVLSRVDGVEGPAVAEGGTLEVRATKCTAPDIREQVGVAGFYVWQRIEPTRLQVEGGEGTGFRQPGCDTRVFSNPLPREIGPGLWHLAGQETAERGASSQTRYWRTENFRVVAP